MHSIMRFGAWTKNKPKPIAHPNRLAFILSTASCGLLSGEIATTTETTDMGIGQVFERMLPYFDYVAPMIYPSHYANGEYGIKVPAEKPYETIMKALAGAKKKTRALATTTSQTISGSTLMHINLVSGSREM